MFTKENIIEVRFANKEQDMIAVLYTEGDDTVEVYVQADAADATYKQLVKAGYSSESIVESTAEYKKSIMQYVHAKMREEHGDEQERVLAAFEEERSAKEALVNELVAEITDLLEQIEARKEELEDLWKDYHLPGHVPTSD